MKESRKVLFPQRQQVSLPGFFLTLHAERQRRNLWIPVSPLSLEQWRSQDSQWGGWGRSPQPQEARGFGDALGDFLIKITNFMHVSAKIVVLKQ